MNLLINNSLESNSSPPKMLLLTVICSGLWLICLYSSVEFFFIFYVKVVSFYIFIFVIWIWGLWSQCPQLVIRILPHRFVPTIFWLVPKRNSSVLKSLADGTEAGGHLSTDVADWDQTHENSNHSISATICFQTPTSSILDIIPQFHQHFEHCFVLFWVFLSSQTRNQDGFVYLLVLCF